MISAARIPSRGIGISIINTGTMDDEQTKKAFIEGEKRVNELAKQLMNCRSQIFSRDRNSRMSDITVGQLQKMETPTTYESVGKM